MKSALTIGVLDGVHLGHRALIAHLDTSLSTTVLTFEPHPVEVLRPGTHPRLITTIDERTDLLETLGIDRVIALDLADVKELNPGEFVNEYLVGELAISQVVVGSDFRFGRDRSGDVDLLRDMGAAGGWTVEAIDLVVDRHGPVSSSRIRGLIEAGDFGETTALMGSHFTVTAEVVHGDKRGREIGFPTANMAPPERKIIPATGVYACFARLGDETHRAAVNVGYRPTFGGEELVVEAFILDFDREIYGQTLQLHFVDRLRPEIRFDTVDELVDTMRDDVSRADRILELASSPNMS